MRQLRRAASGPVVAAVLIVVGLVPADASSRPGSAPLPLRFHRELVRLTVERDTVEVEGFYRMLCTPGAAPKAFLLYPYPRENGMGEARTLLVECRGQDGPWRPVEFLERSPYGARWTVPLDLGDTLTIHTVYRQALHGQQARYIVSTTRNWEHPLARARFEIRLPVGASPLRFSHPFVLEPGGRDVYVYEESEFWPDRDISVTWSDR